MHHTLECVVEDAGRAEGAQGASSAPMDHMWTCLRDLLVADSAWVADQGVLWLYLVLLTAAQHHMRLHAGGRFKAALWGALCAQRHMRLHAGGYFNAALWGALGALHTSRRSSLSGLLSC